MRIETYDTNGNLLKVREVPDPIPTPEERIAELEAALDTVTLALLEVLA